jgi:hypothetical protein
VSCTKSHESSGAWPPHDPKYSEITAQAAQTEQVFGAVFSNLDAVALGILRTEVAIAVEEYKRRLKDRESRVARHEQIHIRLGYVRVSLALVAAVIGWESFWRHGLSPWWMVALLILFVFIAAYHSRILRARDLAKRAMAFYHSGLARSSHECDTF